MRMMGFRKWYTHLVLVTHLLPACHLTTCAAMSIDVCSVFARLQNGQENPRAARGARQVVVTLAGNTHI